MKIPWAVVPGSFPPVCSRPSAHPHPISLPHYVCAISLSSSLSLPPSLPLSQNLETDSIHPQTFSASSYVQAWAHQGTANEVDPHSQTELATLEGDYGTHRYSAHNTSVSESVTPTL